MPSHSVPGLEIPCRAQYVSSSIRDHLSSPPFLSRLSPSCRSGFMSSREGYCHILCWFNLSKSASHTVLAHGRLLDGGGDSMGS